MEKAFPEVSRAGRALEEPEEPWECSRSPLPHWAHLKQQLQQREGVGIRAKINAKKPCTKRGPASTSTPPVGKAVLGWCPESYGECAVCVSRGEAVRAGQLLLSSLLTSFSHEEYSASFV